MGKFSTQLRRSSPTILTCLSVAGIIGTAVMAVRATPKALILIKEKKAELEIDDGTDKLSLKDIVLTTWRCYIPAVLIGFSTIICVVGINATSKRNQASLASAYAMLSESYRRYRNAAKTVYGEDADDKIHAEMAKDACIGTDGLYHQTYNMDMDSESERVLCYEMISQRYFTTTMAAVINAQYHINRNLQLRGYCSVNEYFSFLGIDEIENGNEMGWDLNDLYCGGEQWLDFDNYKSTLEDGLECIIITTNEPNRFGEDVREELNT